MVAFSDATVLHNNTLSSSHAAHIGQLFWDQDLIEQVETRYPYNTNTVDITLNADELGTNAESDPFFQYAYLGDAVEDGIFGWITIGINRTASYETSYSFEYTSSGGVAVENAAGGGGGGAPSGTGTPSGSAPPAASSTST